MDHAKTHRNVLLRVLEVLEESVLVPGDTLLLVALRVGKAGDLAGLTAEKAVQVGANLVGATLKSEKRGNRIRLAVQKQERTMEKNRWRPKKRTFSTVWH